MNTTLSIIGGVLSVLFLLAGVFKLIQTKEKIVTGGGAWAADFANTNIKIIGAVECLLAIGLALGWFVIGSSLLSMLSAIGMAFIMLSATVVHIRRKEYGFVALTIVVAGMAVFLIANSCS